MRLDEITEGKSGLSTASRNKPWKDSIFRDRKEHQAKKGNSKEESRKNAQLKKPRKENVSNVLKSSLESNTLTSKVSKKSDQ